MKIILPVYKKRNYHSTPISRWRLLATLLVFFAFTFLLEVALHSSSLKFYKINEYALEDVDLTDIYYWSKNSDIREDKYPILLINSGSLDSAQARHQILKILPELTKAGPTAIGIDINFVDANKEIEVKPLLGQALQYPKIIVGTDYNDVPLFPLNPTDEVKLGYTNLPVKKGQAVREYFDSLKDVGEKKQANSFARELALTVDPGAVSRNQVLDLKYATRGKGFYNALHSKGSRHGFPAIEADALLSADSAVVKKALAWCKGRILIIGQLSDGNMEYDSDIRDKHRVPTDAQLFNRLPTVAGAVIHANAVRMMLAGDYLDKSSGVVNFILCISTLYIYLLFFTKVDRISSTIARLLIELAWLILFYFIILYIGIAGMEFGCRFPIMKLLIYITLLLEFKIFVLEFYERLDYRVFNWPKKK